MKKAIWTVLGLILAGAAAFPTVSSAGIYSNHSESLVRDPAAQ